MATDGKCPPILTKITICQQILLNCKILNLKKTHPAGVSRSMQTDGWKGGRQTNK